MNPVFAKKVGLSAKEIAIVEHSAQTFSDEMGTREHLIKSGIQRASAASTDAHQAAQDKVLKRYPNLAVAEEPTGITGKPPRSEAQLKKSDVQINPNPPTGEEAKREYSTIVEHQRTAWLERDGTLVTDPRPPKPGVERVETEQIQTYELMFRALGIPTFVTNGEGQVFAPNPDGAGWILVGGPPKPTPKPTPK